MAKKLTRAEKMRRYMVANPEQTVAQVATEFGVPYQTAYMAKRGMNKAIEKTVNRIEAELRKPPEIPPIPSAATPVGQEYVYTYIYYIFFLLIYILSH